MSHGPTIIPSKGQCIYCGDQSAKLTDEHILPFGLGGAHVIEKASCKACNTITSRFELDVLRGLWADARIAYNFPTRRKKERRSKSHLLVSDGGNPGAMHRVLYADLPAVIAFYRMQKAGILHGLPPNVDISSSWKMVVVTDDQRLEAFKTKYGFNPALRFVHQPVSFSRMLAKIAFGHILTELDLGDFRPICLPYIRGEEKNLSFIVGGHEEQNQPRQELGYVLQTRLFGLPEHVYLVAEVRLFANLDTPTYHVVVGDVRGRDAVDSVLTKYSEKGTAIDPFSTIVPLDPGMPWAPSVWPLLTR